MTAPLAPCPFCGTAAELVVGTYGGYWGECLNAECGVRAPMSEDKADAIARWNERTP